MVLSLSLVQRLFANFVLLVTLWGYVAPAALGPSEAGLPACCRGKGKHHCCRMTTRVRVDDGAPGFRNNPPQCPYRLLGSVLNRGIVAIAKESFSLELPAADAFSECGPVRRASVIPVRCSGRSPPAFAA